MKEILILLFLFIVGYVFFMGTIAMMVKLFFPFFTKEELEKRQKLARSLTQHKKPSISFKFAIHSELQRSRYKVSTNETPLS